MVWAETPEKEYTVVVAITERGGGRLFDVGRDTGRGAHGVSSDKRKRRRRLSGVGRGAGQEEQCTVVVAIRGGQRAEGGRLSVVGGRAGREEDYTVAVTIRGRRGGGCRLSGVGGGTRREVVYAQ